MTNYTLTVSKNTYEKTPHSTRLGYVLVAHSQRELADKPHRQFSKPNASVIDVIDEALADLLRQVAIGYDVADVTVDTGDYTLSAAQQTTLKEKYELEAQINSVTFA